jgi:hypothetical protein
MTYTYVESMERRYLEKYKVLGRTGLPRTIPHSIPVNVAGFRQPKALRGVQEATGLSASLQFVAHCSFLCTFVLICIDVSR